MKKKIVMVFGAFDGLHDGHRFFLREAKKHGDSLIAVVAQDEVVTMVKKHEPKHALAERMQALLREGLADEAVPGDTKLGNWSAIKKYKPDIVCAGYDQERLRERLHEHLASLTPSIEIVTAAAHEPKTFHSSLLDKK